jgi:TDG/mug DNA glycosylase family protein
MRSNAQPTLPDYLPLRPDILFVGINPATYSAQCGHYYARPTNRFWWALHASGLLPVRLSPEEDYRIVEFGLALTDLVKRPTNSATEVCGAEFAAGRPALAAKIRRVQPAILCFNGLTGYQQVFQKPTRPGRQARRYHGARVFVVPSTSARNAAYPRHVILAYFCELKAWREALCRDGERMEG